MINAFLYLQFTTLKNRLVQRVVRLKQPKYFFGALVGAGYFYFFFFRKIFAGPFNGSNGTNPTTPISSELAPYLTLFGGLLLLVIVVLAWVIPSGRAALRFTEAEVAFLFPAPITRQRLIHFKLLRSQFAILASTFLLTLIFRRTNFIGGNPFAHAAGWWVILSTLSLHFTAASFGREQLLHLGLNPHRRRALAVGGLAVIIFGCTWWIRHHVTPPSDAEFSGASTLIHYAGSILQQPPCNWILAPFALVVRPYFTTDLAGFFTALGPAIAIMAAHYWWVMRANVSFEEASIDQARKLAERVSAVRSGDWQAARNQPLKSRTPAFVLAPQGMVVAAFFWKNLIALGPFFRLRTWLILVALILGFHTWAGLTHLEPKVYTIISSIPFGFGCWLIFAGPMFMRRDVRLLVTHFDLLKGYPLRGWQVILGSLLSPIILLAAIEWLLLLWCAPGLGASGKGASLAVGVFGVGALGIALILPPLVGLMLSIPFAATLYFPAWIEHSNTRGGGIEVMGQRLIFFAGYVIVLLVALLPAIICGGLAAFIIHWLIGTIAAVVTTALVASVIIGAEFAALVWWLGERFEQFDLSAELPR